MHQWIAYGGTFGEYYTYGLQSYLLAFALYWAMSSTYLLLYAAVLRALFEPWVVVTACWVSPRTPTVRRGVERLIHLLYYGGVPVFLLRLFFQS